MATVAVLFSAVTGVAQAVPGGKDEVAVPVNAEMSMTFPAMARIPGFSAKSVEENPPGGNCTWYTNFNGYAYYADGVLVRTDIPYSTSLTCTSTAAGQTMRYLLATTEM